MQNTIGVCLWVIFFLFFLLLLSWSEREGEREKEEKMWFSCGTLFSALGSRFILSPGIDGSVRHAVHLFIATLPVPIEPDGPPTAEGSVPADFSLWRGNRFCFTKVSGDWRMSRICWLFWGRLKVTESLLSSLKLRLISQDAVKASLKCQLACYYANLKYTTDQFSSITGVY